MSFLRGAIILDRISRSAFTAFLLRKEILPVLYLGPFRNGDAHIIIFTIQFKTNSTSDKDLTCLLQKSHSISNEMPILSRQQAKVPIPSIRVC